MTKKVTVSLVLAALIIALFFIQVDQQKTISVKAPFLNVYALLSNPAKWPAWQSSLRKAVAADSGKIVVDKKNGGFTIKYDSLAIDVKQNENVFDVIETDGGAKSNYSYGIIPGLFDKQQGNTKIVVDRQTSAMNYLLGLFMELDFAKTHAGDIKRYFETDSLLYGYHIFKTSVPDANLIEVGKKVLKKDKFTTAAQLLATLQTYVKVNNIRQMQPFIAQFLRKGKDSSQVNVGFFIDREVKSDNLIHFVRMPLGGALYAATYHGPFNKRQKVYNALDLYFTDHLYQQAIIPFEMYLDNKLPKSDVDNINMRVNYTAYY
jgi:effector-binding domain-containing protein